jgi:hypothetical protein
MCFFLIIMNITRKINEDMVWSTVVRLDVVLHINNRVAKHLTGIDTSCAIYCIDTYTHSRKHKNIGNSLVLYRPSCH